MCLFLTVDQSYNRWDLAQWLSMNSSSWITNTRIPITWLFIYSSRSLKVTWDLSVWATLDSSNSNTSSVNLGFTAQGKSTKHLSPQRKSTRHLKATYASQGVCVGPGRMHGYQGYWQAQQFPPLPLFVEWRGCLIHGADDWPASEQQQVVDLITYIHLCSSPERARSFNTRCCTNWSKHCLHFWMWVSWRVWLQES
jgi:hypothetical protein